MRKIKINKIDVLLKLKDNKENHLKEYEMAKKKYKAVALKYIENIKNDILKKDKIDFSSLTSLIEPVNKIKEYNKAIKMFEMEVEEVIELNSDEFEWYILDNWEWTNFSKISNSTYMNYQG